MSIKGGYKIVSLNGVGLMNAEGVIISGTYAKLENNYRKAIMLSDVTINGTEYPDMWPAVTIDGGSYVLDLGADLGKITVTAEDLVTFSAAAE